jgi:D-glycero-alpha-D-manno-heptose 1-phosphate guanylyltransferase
MSIPVLILAGGMGTRLKSVVPDLPKPLADISGKPFLWWLLNELSKQGITEVYLSVGYLHEHIQEFFGDQFQKIKIKYVIESEPLGTGGAINKACQAIPDSRIMIMNGDTFASIDLTAYIQFAAESPEVQVFLATYKISDSNRYGTVKVSASNVLTEFLEKGNVGEGLINAGVYILDKKVFKQYNLPEKFSFETDFLTKYCSDLNILAYQDVTDFIDIGIPSDYQLAQTKIPSMVNPLE